MFEFLMSLTFLQIVGLYLIIGFITMFVIGAIIKFMYKDEEHPLKVFVLLLWPFIILLIIIGFILYILSLEF